MRRLLSLLAPLLSRIAPAAPVTIHARWEQTARRLARAVAQKRFEQIDGLLDEALELVGGMDPADAETVARLNLIGDHCHNVAGRNADAETAYREAVELSGDRPGPLAASLNNLALLLLRQSRSEEAEPLLRRLLGVIEESRGPEDSEYATALVNLAAALRQLGKNEEASKVRAEAARLQRNG